MENTVAAATKQRAKSGAWASNAWWMLLIGVGIIRVLSSLVSSSSYVGSSYKPPVDFYKVPITSPNSSTPKTVTVYDSVFNREQVETFKKYVPQAAKSPPPGYNEWLLVGRPEAGVTCTNPTRKPYIHGDRCTGRSFQRSRD